VMGQLHEGYPTLTAMAPPNVFKKEERRAHGLVRSRPDAPHPCRWNDAAAPSQSHARSLRTRRRRSAGAERARRKSFVAVPPCSKAGGRLPFFLIFFYFFVAT